MTDERQGEIAKLGAKLYEGWTEESANIPDDIYDDVMEEYHRLLQRDEDREHQEYEEMIENFPKEGPLAELVPLIVDLCGNVPIEFLGGRFAVDRRGNWLSSGGDTWLPSSLDEVLEATSLDAVVAEFKEILQDQPYNERR